jgi:hypothetical protein
MPPPVFQTGGALFVDFLWRRHSLVEKWIIG